MSARLNLTRHYTQNDPQSPTALQRKYEINGLLFAWKSVL